MKTILINNQFVTEEKAQISIFSPILRGYGVFETLRTFPNKKLFQAQQHISRLHSSANQIKLKIPYSSTSILEQLHNLIAKSPHELQRIKILAIPNTLIIFSEQLKPQPEEAAKTISLHQTRSLPTIKSISYLDSYLANQTAQEQGASEALLLEKDGTVLEGAYSNIFWIKDHILYTRNDQILPGITRAAVLKISHLKTKFSHIHIKDLKKADEVFLTSSIKGITPIKQIDQTIIHENKETQILRGALSKLRHA